MLQYESHMMATFTENHCPSLSVYSSRRSRHTDRKPHPKFFEKSVSLFHWYLRERRERERERERECLQKESRDETKKKKDEDMTVKEFNDEISNSSLPDYDFASSGRFANDATLSTRYLTGVKRSARKEETKIVSKSKQLFSLTFDKFIRSPTAARTLIYNGMPFLLSGENVPGRKPSKKNFLAGIQALRSKPVGNKALRDKHSEFKNKLRTARVRTL